MIEEQCRQSQRDPNEESKDEILPQNLAAVDQYNLPFETKRSIGNSNGLFQINDMASIEHFSDF